MLVAYPIWNTPLAASVSAVFASLNSPCHEYPPNCFLMVTSVFALGGCDPGPKEPAANFVSHFQLPSNAFMKASRAFEGASRAAGAAGVVSGLGGVGAMVRAAGFDGAGVSSNGSSGDTALVARVVFAGEAVFAAGFAAELSATATDPFQAMARANNKRRKAPLLGIGAPWLVRVGYSKRH